MCDFLAKAERIAISTVEIACDSNHNHSQQTIDCDEDNRHCLHDSITNDEEVIKEIIANDDRLNKEVGDLFDMHSFLWDEDGADDVGDDGEQDEITDCLIECML